jgi:predicted ester cyclase
MMKPISKSGMLSGLALFLFIRLSALDAGTPVLASTQPTEVNMTTISTSTPEQNKEAVRRLFEECINGRKLEMMKQFVAPEYRGATGETFEETIKIMLAGFPDIQWTVEDLIAEGDKVVLKWTWHGTHKGMFRGQAPTQKIISNSAIVIYRMKDGKIAEAWLQTDRLGFFQQMGLVPEGLGQPPKK